MCMKHKPDAEVFHAGRRIVFNQKHNIMPDIPQENIEAMYRTAVTH